MLNILDILSRIKSINAVVDGNKLVLIVELNTERDAKEALELINKYKLYLNFIK